MKTDKETLDALFEERASLEDKARKARKELAVKIALIDKEIQIQNNNIQLAFAEYAYEVLSDPNNQENYGRPFMTSKELVAEVSEKEPRFTEWDIVQGINKLISEGPPRVEKRVEYHKTSHYMDAMITTYRLKEEKK